MPKGHRQPLGTGFELVRRRIRLDGRGRHGIRHVAPSGRTVTPGRHATAGQDHSDAPSSTSAVSRQPALDMLDRGMSPPAYWPHGSPRRPRCSWGGDARRSSANVRLPATAQVHTVEPFVLDGLPGTPPAGHSPCSVGWTRLRRVLLRWQAPQPCPSTRRRPHPAQLRGLDPYVIPYALGMRTPGFGSRGCLCSSVPPRGSGGAHTARCASRD
jgi:hypothetical protein